MKYMGSKSRIATHIVPIIQSYIDTNHINKYYEPFCGGCNIIDKIQCEHKYASDINSYLIALLQHIASGGVLPPDCSYELYNQVRTDYQNGIFNYEDWYIGAIGFLASYNGRFFDGGYAKPAYEKTKSGLRYRDYYQEAKRNLEKQVPQLSNIEFNCVSYNRVQPINSVIYYDPPYQNTKQYANIQYFDYDEFWMLAQHLSQNNIVLVSELNAPDDWYCIWEQSISRSINANDKTQAVEKLFIHL